MNVWVGRSVAAVKPPPVCVASGLDHAGLVFSLTQAYF